MKSLILRRILQTLPLGLGVTFLTFLLIHLAPGDILSQLKLNPQISAALVEQLRSDFGLDRGLLHQYFSWLRRLAVGDMGLSLSYRIPVLNLVAERAGATLLLAFSAMAVSWLVALPMGMAAAWRPHGWVDRICSVLAFLGLSIPNFFLALLLIFFAARSGWFPTGGLTSANYESLGALGKLADILWHLVLPTLVLATAGMASLFRITRSQMMRALGEPFIEAARARGLTERAILFRHALRASLSPLITLFGYELAGLLSGAALTEIVFSYPGLGRLVLDAILAQDMYLVAGATLAGFLLLMAGNMISDILLALNDPRLRFHGRRS